MDYDDWFVKEFRDTLGEPLTPAHGISRRELDVLTDGRKLPKSMCAYYRVAGNHWLNSNYNELLRPDSFEISDDYTIFMHENQDVVHWAISNGDLTADDPIVYQTQPAAPNSAWYPEKYTFSQFMIALWRWVLTGDDPD